VPRSRLERLRIGRIDADQIGNRAGQEVAKEAETGSENGIAFELPGIALLGCKMAMGVEENKLPRCVESRR